MTNRSEGRIDRDPERIPLAPTGPVEIEGMATVEPLPAADLPSVPPHPVANVHDEIVVASLPEDHLRTNPGGTAILQVCLLNNGSADALFQLVVEGWIDSHWVDGAPLHVRLGPGEKTVLEIPLSPPRRPESRAGDHPFVVLVRSEAYPGRFSRLAATLTIAPFVEVRVGDILPRRAQVGPRGRTARLTAPIVNLGNCPVEVRLAAHDLSGRCTFDIRRSDGSAAESTSLTLAPGQRADITLRARLLRPLLFAWRLRPLPFRVQATLPDETQIPRAAGGQLLSQPLIGPWQLAAAAAILFALLAAASLLGAAGLSVVGLLARTLPPATPVPPPLAIVLQIAEPLPTAQDSAPPFVLSEGAVSSPLPAAPEVDAPLVRREQVSAPGASAPAAAAQIPPAAGGADMTYAAMFREIGLRYDLDWRILAAQAYVESGFNSLALGADGDLGLMQILPSTWQEWAPVAGAADPFDSYSNVLVAAVYLDHLRSRLGQQGYADRGWMLAAYNWGPDQLGRFLAAGGTWTELPQAQRSYVEEILRITDTIPVE